MKKKILLIRPQAASQRWAKVLIEQGFDCAVEPLMHIEPTYTPFPDADYQAVLLTSANAADALYMMQDICSQLSNLPCFCVGEASGRAARAAGFIDVHCGTSDSIELARVVVAALQDEAPLLLHVCGHPTDDKLQLFLANAGFALTAWPIYQAVAYDDMSPQMLSLFKTGNIGCIPVFSPRSARILVELIEKNHLVEACSTVVVVALSQAVANVLQTVPWRQLLIAASPSSTDILACLEELSMTDPNKMSSMANPIVSKPRKSLTHKIGLAVAAILLLSGVGFVTLCQPSWLLSFLHRPENPLVLQNIDALEDRVHMLESAQKPESTVVGAAEINPAVSGLAESIRKLQVQVAELQDVRAHDKQNTQKDIAASFAFWSLRSAVDEGRGYGAPLGAFHESLNDTLKKDASITECLTVLFSYAGGVETYTQLHDDLSAHEPALDTISDAEISGWLNHLRKVMHSLISVRPVHSPAFDTLENDLAKNDGSSAVSAFDSLPAEARSSLSTWHEKLKERVSVEAAMRTLAVRLAVPATEFTSEGAP